MAAFRKDAHVRVAAICDVFEPNLERGLSAASKMAGNQPKVYRNYKELLADKDIDAVLIATPEHWHARMVLDALAAGKDIYVEKPLWRQKRNRRISSRWECSGAVTICTWKAGT
jgi:predicted dehydrogenase